MTNEIGCTVRYSDPFTLKGFFLKILDESEDTKVAFSITAAQFYESSSTVSKNEIVCRAKAQVSCDEPQPLSNASTIAAQVILAQRCSLSLRNAVAHCQVKSTI